MRLLIIDQRKMRLSERRPGRITRREKSGEKRKQLTALLVCRLHVWAVETMVSSVATPPPHHHPAPGPNQAPLINIRPHNRKKVERVNPAEEGDAAFHTSVISFEGQKKKSEALY